MSDDPRPSLSRRQLLATAPGAAAALTLARLGDAPAAAGPAGSEAPGGSMIGVPFERHDTVRLGLVGYGGRGESLLRDLLAIDGIAVKAVCDIVPEKVAKAQAAVEKAGQARPEAYAKGERDFENLCRRGDLDLVYVATPWNWHVPMAVAAMEGGAHAGVEVPPAVSLDECWRLVHTSERTRRHCVILENCCYGWSEMLVMNLVRAGLLGDLVHGECAYIHDLRELLFEDEGEGLWRRYEHFRRDGNLYPTHGLGPVSLYMGIHRGDRFETLVSMSSPSLGLQAYRDRALAAGDPKRQETYACGDVNTSLLRTVRGRTVVLQHAVVSPRPYSRINLVSGTKGTFADYPPRLFLDGQKEEAWQELHRKGERPEGGIEDRFEDPLWKRLAGPAERSGHGGMDYVMSWRLVQCLREGLPPDLDVYDAAAWSAPSALSETSVAQGSAPQAFPDFTGGRWSEKRG
jgi:predicted dehydrogenase